MGDVAGEAAAAPWAFAERLLGQAPRMVERQPIRPVAGGRSFASTDVFTPLHTDSQLHLGAPPDAQVMVCARPADDGGESLLCDGWALLDLAAREDPALFDALFTVRRRMPFVFGDVYGPTAALRGGSLAITHSPVATPAEPVAARLAPLLARAPVAAVPVAAGDVLVADNRRTLHGRNAFGDTRREFVRLLVWLPAPLAEHPEHTRRARAVAAETERLVAGEPASVRARFGALPPPDEAAARRLRVVTAMLQGAPPGALSAREGIPEPVLYQLRDAALTAALAALDASTSGDVSPRCAEVLRAISAARGARGR